jgi:hypothetical protein
MYFSLVHQLDQPTGKPIEPTAPALNRTMHAPTWDGAHVLPWEPIVSARDTAYVCR